MMLREKIAGIDSETAKLSDELSLVQVGASGFTSYALNKQA